MMSPTDRHPDATNTPQRTTSLNQARPGYSHEASFRHAGVSGSVSGAAPDSASGVVNV
jgi:hypothetical protein